MLRLLFGISGVLVIAVSLSSCSDDALVVSKNLSKAADNFEINRRIVFYNGITEQYILTIEGYCSLKKDHTDNQLEVTCKTGPSSYRKHLLGLSDNVTYFAEQVGPESVSAYYYRVAFRPQTIIPEAIMYKPEEVQRKFYQDRPNQQLSEEESEKVLDVFRRQKKGN